MEKKGIRICNAVLLVCAAVCLVCYDIFGGLWLKGVTSCWFVILGGVNVWAARHLRGKQLRFLVLMEAGLVCGMCADVLLGLVFFAGLGVFALGHLLYLAAFYTLEGFCRQDVYFMAPLAVVSVFAVVGTPWIRVEDPVLRTLLVGYALIISGMLGKALSNLVCRRSPGRWLMAVGSVLFWFSDLMLAVDMFGQASRLTWILCSYSYWPAQNLLAHGLYYTETRREERL